MERLDVLAGAIQDDRELILSEWRRRVRELPSARHLDRLALEDNLRSVLDEISNALMLYHDSGALPTPYTAIEHGRQRFEVGFDLHQVVIEYNMLRHVLRECAARHHISLDDAAGSVLHRIIDEDIAIAVMTHSRQQTSRHAAEINERVADLVHDIKSPMSAIQTAAHILETRLSSESRQAVSTMLRIIRRNCDNLNVMLSELLDSAAEGQRQLNATEVDVKRVVDDVVERFAPLGHTKNTPLRSLVPAGTTVVADPFLLQQMLENLVSNALKYTEEGEIAVGTASSDDRVSIWVRDTGRGIAAEQLPQLFTRGERDPERADSSGLGLSIVKKIVDAHHGEIRVESQPGAGATFTVSLPRPPLSRAPQ